MTVPKPALKDTIEDIIEFRSIVNFLNQRTVLSDKNFPKDSAVYLVKAYNSIASYNLSNNAGFNIFYNRFEREYAKIITKKMKGVLSIGGGLYFPADSLHLGGLQFPFKSYVFVRSLKYLIPWLRENNR